MKVKNLLALARYDSIRFYEQEVVDDNSFIDEFTPFSWFTKVDPEREVDFITFVIEGSNGEIEDCYLAAILKEEIK